MQPVTTTRPSLPALAGLAVCLPLVAACGPTDWKATTVERRAIVTLETVGPRPATEGQMSAATYDAPEGRVTYLALGLEADEPAFDRVAITGILAAHALEGLSVRLVRAEQTVVTVEPGPQPASIEHLATDCEHNESDGTLQCATDLTTTVEVAFAFAGGPYVVRGRLEQREELVGYTPQCPGFEGCNY